MKKMILFLSSIVVCWACNDKLEPAPETTDPIEIELKSYEKEWAANGNAFAMNLFAAACENPENTSENVLLSPLSLQFALGMLSNGTNETGLNEIATALGFSNYSRDEVNSYFGKLTSSLSEGDPSVALNLANSAWIQKDFAVKDKFVRALKEAYQAKVDNTVNFLTVEGRAEAQKAFDKWCSEQTKGTIKELNLSLSAATRLILANACYFKGQWTLPFESVEKGTFTTSKGAVQQADMMKLDKTLNYAWHSDYQAVELPYGNESFSMIVVLPDEGKSVEEAAAAIEWKNMRFGGRGVEVTMPKFKLKGHTELNPMLRKMGINEIYNTLPDIAEGLFVSRVFQEMFIETNETGTEAAAVTVAVLTTSPGPGESGKIEMKMDRPFLFAIRENSTGVILFMGKVGNIDK